MKPSEFEEKLTLVSDSKLKRMLAESRKHGPDVAVNLILAEASRRGVVLEAEPEPPLPDYVRRDPQAEAGPAPAHLSPATAPADVILTPVEPGPEMPAGASGVDSDAPAVKGAWLADEQETGLPVFLKIVLSLIVLGIVASGLVYLLNKHG